MTAKRLLSRAIELVLEDWPEDHPEVETFLKEAREFVASSGEADDEARRMANLLHDELGTGGNGSETPYSIAERAVTAYKRLERDAARYRWLADGFALGALDVNELFLDADEMSRELFDKLVDAAMSAQSDKEESK